MEQATNKKSLYIIAGIAFLVLVAGIYFLFVFQKKSKEQKQENVADEVKTINDIAPAKRPFVTLTPTSDGAEMIISIEKMVDFDKIEYELTYQADNPTSPGQKIQRGATGEDVNTKDPKYKKSILLGTASRGVRSPDRGITDGKLTLHLHKGNAQYDSDTPWTLLQAGSKADEIADASGNFKLTLPALGKDYWMVLADTVGIPPEDNQFAPEKALLPVYGFFSVGPTIKSGQVAITLTKDSSNPVLYSFDHQEEKWQKLDSKYNSSSKTVTADIASLATFVIVSQK